MYRTFLIYLTAIVLLVAANNDDIADPNNENDIEEDLDFFVNSNDTELPSLRFAPFASNEKAFVIVATAQVNWFAAQQICSYRGLTLASLNSAKESEDLRRYLFNNGLDAGKNFWLSGTDLASSDNWSWFSTGRPLVYDNFAQDVVDYDYSEEEKHCMVLRPDGRWLKESCNTQAYFICENRCPLNSYTESLVPTPQDARRSIFRRIFG